MLKLYKKLSKLDWLLVVFIMGLTVLQVYCTMTLVDYVQGIIKAITYVNYHNNPGDISATLAEMVEAGGWESIKAYVNSSNFPASMENMKEYIIAVADANVGDIWFNGCMMMVIAVGVMAVQAVIAILASKVAADLSTRVRRDLYEQIEKFSLAEINKFSTASLVTRTTNDIQHIQMANLLTMRMIFQAPVTAIWAICKLQASSLELTLTTGIALVALILLIVTMMLVVLPKFKVVQSITDKLNGVTRDNLTGVRVVRAFNAEKYETDKFEKVNKEYTVNQMFTSSAMAILMPGMMLIMNGLSLGIYLVGANLVNNGTIDYATITAFVMLGSQIIMAFVMLLMLFIIWPRALVAAKRVNEVLETNPSILDPTNPVENDKNISGELEFKNVCFKYSDGDNNVISDISFKVLKGETLAIIGATSSGKTSLINLISRLYDATSGEVLVDGVNVKNYKQEFLRNKIGFVPQKGFLFNGSIKENIAFGADQIDMDRVEFASNVSCSSEFINEKDEGFDFVISQGGKNVSGGQRQRLCIARCVYRSPEIYVFDDSFSALDYKTDKKVRDNLNELDKNATKIIVAQRIGTIMDADKIIVLDDGKMVGLGTHMELLESCEVYKEIALSQLTREELGL